MPGRVFAGAVALVTALCVAVAGGGAAAAAATAAAPPAPTAVTAVAGETAVTVCWRDNSNGTAAYVVADGATRIPQALPAGTTCYQWTNLQPGTYHCFAVIAVIAGVYSAWSDWSCATTRLPTPTNLAVRASLDGGHVTVSWSPGAGTPLLTTQYIVTNGNTDSPTLAAGTTSYNWNLDLFSAGQYMCLAVIAVNPAGAESNWTPYVCGTMPTPGFVAMGDSYSSGQGAPPYRDNGCRRSDNTYSVQYQQLSHTPFGAPELVACYGAQTSDITSQNSHGNPGQPAQLYWINGSTHLITLTIGGNDVGFAPILQDCAVLQVPGQEAQCDLDLVNVSGKIKAMLGTLTGVYRAIRTKAPNAKLVVLTYPRIFPAFPCGGTGTGGLTPNQLTLVNAAWSQFNQVIKNAAAQVGGVTVVDVENAFANHDTCSAQPYANGFLWGDPNASYHPTAAGYAAEAALMNQRVADGT